MYPYLWPHLYPCVSTESVSVSTSASIFSSTPMNLAALILTNCRDPSSAHILKFDSSFERKLPHRILIHIIPFKNSAKFASLFIYFKEILPQHGFSPASVATSFIFLTFFFKFSLYSIFIGLFKSSVWVHLNKNRAAWQVFAWHEITSRWELNN